MQQNLAFEENWTKSKTFIQIIFSSAFMSRRRNYTKLKFVFQLVVSWVKLAKSKFVAACLQISWNCCESENKLFLSKMICHGISGNISFDGKWKNTFVSNMFCHQILKWSQWNIEMVLFQIWISFQLKVEMNEYKKICFS